LSDIPHLYRIEYKIFNDLDDKLLKHIERMAPVKNFYDLVDEIERCKGLSHKLYIAETLYILKELRDKKPIRRQEFRSLLKKKGVDPKIMEKLLIRYNLAKPDPGKNGYWKKSD
jgi:hypothetical protein